MMKLPHPALLLIATLTLLGMSYADETRTTKADFLSWIPEKREAADDYIYIEPELSDQCRASIQTGAIARCATRYLSVCVLERPTDSEFVCNCYRRHGECRIQNGCSYDTLEESYMDYCENYLRCTKSQCTGSGASVAAVATTALLAVVLAALRLR